MKYVLIFIIKIYQILISPLFPPSCRFYPTCSNYSIEAIRNCGAIRGVYYSIKRILRCNPFNEGGIDPAPTCNHKQLKQV